MTHTMFQEIRERANRPAGWVGRQGAVDRPDLGAGRRLGIWPEKDRASGGGAKRGRARIGPRSVR